MGYGLKAEKLFLELENGESFSEIISVREDPLKTSN